MLKFAIQKCLIEDIIINDIQNYGKIVHQIP